jgi:hypothetical protein
MAILKEQLKEIVELVALVPEQFKAQCFELLLKEALTDSRRPAGGTSAKTNAEKNGGEEVGARDNDDSQDTDQSEKQGGGQGDVVKGDLHVKTQRFLDKGGITTAKINELFYKEGAEINSLVEDYKSTKMSEIQIRVALFQAFHNGLSTGEFKTTVEAVRAECVDRKAYDANNWAAVFKRKAALFDFSDFSRDVVDLRLSEDGRQELAALLKTLG